MHLANSPATETRLTEHVFHLQSVQMCYPDRWHGDKFKVTLVDEHWVPMKPAAQANKDLLNVMCIFV